MGYALSLNGDASDEDSLRVPELIDQLIARLKEVGASNNKGQLTLYRSSGTHSAQLNGENDAARLLETIEAAEAGQEPAPAGQEPAPAPEAPAQQ